MANENEETNGGLEELVPRRKRTGKKRRRKKEKIPEPPRPPESHTEKEPGEGEIRIPEFVLEEEQEPDIELGVEPGTEGEPPPEPEAVPGSEPDLLALPEKRTLRRPERKPKARVARRGMDAGAKIVIPIIVVAALAALVISIFYTKLSQAHWGFIFYLLVFIVVAQFDLNIKGGGKLSMGIAPVFAALLTAGLVYKETFVHLAPFPVVGVLWLFLFGSIAEIIVRAPAGEMNRDDLLGMLIDYIGVGIMILAFHLIVKILPRGPEFLGYYWPGLLVAFGVAAVIFFLVEAVKLTFIQSQEGHFPPAKYISSIIRRSWSPYLMLIFTGALMGAVYVSTSMWYMLIVLPLLLVIWYAYNRVAATDKYLLDTIKTLSVIPEETGMIMKGHADRVATLSVAVARELGLSPEDALQVEYAAYLHDMGAITHGTDQESEQRELAEVEGVITGGVDIVGKVEYLEVAAEILRGREGLRDRVVDVGKRRAVSLGAGILWAVDDFENLVQGMGKREPMSEQEALTEMNLERGIRYDSKVLRAIARVIPRLSREEGYSSIAEGSTESSPVRREEES